MADSCPVFEHLRGSQGVCELRSQHFDLVAAVQSAAAQRDRTAAIARAEGVAAARRDRAVVNAVLAAAFRSGQLTGPAPGPVQVLRQRPAVRKMVER